MSGHPSTPQRSLAVGVFLRVTERLPGGALARTAVEIVESTVDQVPVLAWARRRMNEVEEAVLGSLRDRLPVGPARPAPSATVSVPTTTQLAWSDPATAFQALLTVADDQSPAEARAAQTLRMVMELVPDEARILRLLSDGSEHPVLQARDGNEHIVVNHSSVGRNARVHANDLTPRYVTHLLALGLVELAPYGGSELMEYELLESETAVRTVLAPYDHRKLVKPRLSREVVRLSEFGRKFCAECMPLSNP